MGAFTSPDQVWYPGLDDKAEINTLLATQAASINNGIGARLRQQEIAVGLKASCARGAWTIPNSTLATIPYQVNGANGDFNNGFDLAGGVASVKTKGMYVVTASLGPQGATNNSGMKIALMQSGKVIGQTETIMQNGVWVNSNVSSVMNCIPGDTIYAQGAQTNVGTSVTENVTTYISIAMVQAVP